MYLFLLLIFCIQTNARTIELTNDNFVSLRSEVNELSINNLINNLIKLKAESRYIYLNTNGGSVDAGLNLINTIKSLETNNISVNCIADTAISMGFVIFQACQGRYVLDHVILMQHQMSLSNVKGQIRNINSYFKFVNNMETKLNKIQAQRIGINLDEFENKIHDDWWLDAEEAIKNNVADEIVQIKCNFENSEEEVIVKELFGDNTYVYSKCPLVSGIIRIKEHTKFNMDKFETDNILKFKTNNILKSNRFIDTLIY